MGKLLRWLFKGLIKLTGFIADVIAIYSFIMNESIEIPGIQKLTETFLDDPILSAEIIGIGLIGTGVFLWDWLEKHASTPFEGYRIFVILQLTLAIFLWILYFQAFCFPLFSISFLGTWVGSMIASLVVSKALSRLMTMSV